jgi:hypothetical protein
MVRERFVFNARFLIVFHQKPFRCAIRNAVRLVCLSAVVLVLLVVSPALADEIYGRIWNSADKRPLAGATVVSENCQRTPVIVDQHGFYRLDVGAKRGEDCFVTIHYLGKNSSKLRIYVKARRTFADIEARQGDDTWLLIRR